MQKQEELNLEGKELMTNIKLKKYFQREKRVKDMELLHDQWVCIEEQFRRLSTEKMQWWGYSDEQRQITPEDHSEGSRRCV